MRRIATAVLLAGCVTPPLDPPSRPRPALFPPRPCPGQAIPVVADGIVTNVGGAPLADVPVSAFDPDAGAWTEIARTGDDGRWKADLGRAVWVSVAPYRAAPPMWCVGIPEGVTLPPPPSAGAVVKMGMGGNDFFLPPLCDWRLELPRAEGPARVVLFSADARVELDADAVDGAIAVRGPCDALAVAAFTDGVASAPAGACDAPRGAACVTPGGGDVRLDPVSTRTLHVVAPGLPGAEITDGLRTALVGDGLAWPVPPDARLRVDAAPRMVAAVDLATGQSANGVLRGETWEVTPPLARLVEVACTAGEVAVPCPPRLTCAAPDAAALPCAPRGDVARCLCPEGDDVVGVGDRRVPVAADAVTATLDLGAAPGGLLARATPGCSALAVRTPSLVDLLGPPVAAATRAARCDDTGALALPALAPGRWRLEVDGHAAVEADVGAATVELGALPPTP